MSGGWLLLAKILILFYVLVFAAGLIVTIVKITVEYTRREAPARAKAEPQQISAAEVEQLKYIKGILNDLRGHAEQGEIVKSNGYSYDIKDVRASIRVIDKILWDAERENRGGRE